MRNWKMFACGIAVGVTITVFFVTVISPYTYLSPAGGGVVRVHRLTGKIERYFNGWKAL